MLEIFAQMYHENTPEKVTFESLYPNRHGIRKVIFLWDTNSYLVDFGRKRFVINGGRNVDFPQYEGAAIEPFIAKRHNQFVGAQGFGEVLTYLLGFEVKKQDAPSEWALLQITEDGSRFAWRDSR